jgi:hypothetical protein
LYSRRHASIKSVAQDWQNSALSGAACLATTNTANPTSARLLKSDFAARRTLVICTTSAIELLNYLWITPLHNWCK